jgi:hypothetical protein
VTRMAWRDMTAEEIAGRPERRLGGALLWMVVVCAIVIVVPTLGMLLAVLVLSTGGIHANPAGIFSWLDGPYRMGWAYMIPVIFFMAWSLIFVVMTLLRLPSTPLVASAGVVMWVAIRLALNYFGQAPLVAGEDRTTLLDALVRLWPYATVVLAETALAAGFCGYMTAGVRPNAYYRRRLPED